MVFSVALCLFASYNVRIQFGILWVKNVLVEGDNNLKQVV